jgi:hypothetical protein
MGVALANLVKMRIEFGYSQSGRNFQDIFSGNWKFVENERRGRG